MKLIRFGDPGHERPGLLRRGRPALDAQRFGEDWDEAFFGEQRAGTARGVAGRRGASLPDVPTARAWARASRVPSKLVCIGLNYGDHARETGAKPPSSRCSSSSRRRRSAGPDDDIVLPPGSTRPTGRSSWRW